ncbi:MAG: hypothetical protein AB1941_22900 [Gemmatimonadota bacterium]
MTATGFVRAALAVRRKDGDEFSKAVLGPSLAAAVAILVALAAYGRVLLSDPSTGPAAAALGAPVADTTPVPVTAFLPAPVQAGARRWGECAGVEADGVALPADGGSARGGRVALHVDVDSTVTAAERDHLRVKLAALLRGGAGADGARLAVHASMVDDPPLMRVSAASATLTWRLEVPGRPAVESVDGAQGRAHDSVTARRNALACAALDVAGEVVSMAGAPRG